MSKVSRASKSAQNGQKMRCNAVDGHDDGACVDDGHDENGGRDEDYLSSIITMLSSLLSANMTVAQLLWRTIYLY